MRTVALVTLVSLSTLARAEVDVPDVHIPVADPAGAVAGDDPRGSRPAEPSRQIGVVRPDEEPFAGEGLFRPPIEWSTWLRGAYGIEQVRAVTATRGVAPAGFEDRGRWELGLGAEASFALSRRGNVRLGGWVELRGWSASDVFAGGELVLTRVPKRLDMFFYEGHGILALRAGRSRDQATAALAYGYVAPFWLEGPCKVRFYEIHTGVCTPRAERTARYMASLRLVASVSRALDNPREWSATLGFEFEPIAALRMFTIARSWY